MGEVFSGSLSSADGGINGLGAWVGSGGTTTISWSVQQNGDYSWHFDYTLTVPDKDISHIVFELSESFTTDDIFNITGPDGDPQISDYDKSNGNPDIPAAIHGIKFDNTSGTTLTIGFDAWRIPVWGDFYAKNGKDKGKDGKFLQVWNAGLEADDPTEPYGNGSKQNHILVPDSVQDPIPEPAVLSVLALGGVALLRRRRRAATR